LKPGEVAQSVSRGAFYLSLERIAALASGLLYFALLLRWLGPTKYGVMAIGLSFVALVTLATGNLEIFLERYAADYQASGRMRTLRRALRLSVAIKLGLGLTAAAVLAALAAPLAAQFGEPELARVLPWFCVLIAVDGLATTGRSTLFGLQRFRALFVMAVAFHVVKVLLVAALWGARQGLLAFAIGLAAMTLLQSIALWAVAAWAIRRSAHLPADDEPSTRVLLRTMLGYTAPLFGVRAIVNAGQNLVKVILGKVFDAITVGYFSFAYQMVERFVELAHTVPMALLPAMTQLVARGERERLRRVFDQAFRLIQVAACVLSFLVFAFAREITLTVASPLFEPAIPIVQILALVPMLRTAQQPLAMLFQALRRPGAVLWLAVLRFALEFGSYAVLLPALGVIGAATAHILGMAVSYAAAHLLLNALFPEGAGERGRAALTNTLWLLAALPLAWLGSEVVGGAAGFALRLAMVPVVIVAVFALRQVTRHDFLKLGSIPLRHAPVRHLRDALVARGDRFARRFEKPRPA
jgi:O-antigen/teichoic acid export membrane protein